MIPSIRPVQFGESYKLSYQSANETAEQAEAKKKNRRQMPVDDFQLTVERNREDEAIALALVSYLRGEGLKCKVKSMAEEELGVNGDYLLTDGVETDTCSELEAATRFAQEQPVEPAPTLTGSFSQLINSTFAFVSTYLIGRGLVKAEDPELVVKYKKNTGTGEIELANPEEILKRVQPAPRQVEAPPAPTTEAPPPPPPPADVVEAEAVPVSLPPSSGPQPGAPSTVPDPAPAQQTPDPADEQMLPPGLISDET